jgi:hypothetical protein
MNKKNPFTYKVKGCYQYSLLNYIDINTLIKHKISIVIINKEKENAFL